MHLQSVLLSESGPQFKFPKSSLEGPETKLNSFTFREEARMFLFVLSVLEDPPVHFLWSWDGFW